MKRNLRAGLSQAPASPRQGVPDRPDSDVERLANGQHLLGHKGLETTLAFYAAINENLAIDRWQTYLADKKSRQPNGLKKKGLR